MIITKRHALLIKQLKDKWSQGLQLDKVEDELNDEDLESLVHLELSGLVEEGEDGYGLTQAGHLISEAIEECSSMAGDFESWPDNFKFIGSEVISMIEVARQAQGDIDKQPEISAQLEKRGMAVSGRLLPVAESILEAYDAALPRISLTPTLMEGLRKCPPGPGVKSLLPFSRDEIWELEAMRLLTFSLPKGSNYSLTGPGQQIRAALIKAVAPSPVLDDQMLLLLLKEDLDTKERQILQAAGAMDDQGNLLPGGKALRVAARLLYAQPIELVPSVCIDKLDFTVLEVISDLVEKGEQDPNIQPDTKSIKERLEARGISKSETHRALLVLEGYQLIEPSWGKADQMIYTLTGLGHRILEDRGKHGFESVSARAVMAITVTRIENLSPEDKWLELAEKQTLVGKGFPTKSGQLFSKMACDLERMPVVDTMQRRVMDVMPYWRGMFVHRIFELLPGIREEDIVQALDRLAGSGLVDLMPGGLCRISEAGEFFKRAMSVVPEGIEFHVTPHMLRLLDAAARHQTNGKIDWKQTERSCGLEADIISETVLAMRKLMYIKSDKITNAGKLLLDGLDILSRAKVEWEEIEI